MITRISEQERQQMSDGIADGGRGETWSLNAENVLVNDRTGEPMVGQQMSEQKAVPKIPEDLANLHSAATDDSMWGGRRIRTLIEQIAQDRDWYLHQIKIVNDAIAALTAEGDALVRELERHASIEEKAHLQTIDERDAAEECLSQMYYLITGKSPEWSNLFGHSEALSDVDDAQKCLRADANYKAVENARLSAPVIPDSEQLERFRSSYFANGRDWKENTFRILSRWEERDRPEIIAARASTPASVAGIGSDGPCGSCGLLCECWFTNSPLWNQVNGGEAGLLCLRCFVTKAEAMRIDRWSWRLSLDDAPTPTPPDANTSWFCVPCGFTTRDAAEAQAHLGPHMIELTCPFCNGLKFCGHTQGYWRGFQLHLDHHAAQKEGGQ